jgi:hypothetical protein
MTMLKLDPWTVAVLALSLAIGVAWGLAGCGSVNALTVDGGDGQAADVAAAGGRGGVGGDVVDASGGAGGTAAAAGSSGTGGGAGGRSGAGGACVPVSGSSNCVDGGACGFFQNGTTPYCSTCRDAQGHQGSGFCQCGTLPCCDQSCQS